MATLQMMSCARPRNACVQGWKPRTKSFLVHLFGEDPRRRDLEDHPFGLGSRGPAPMRFLEVSLGRRVVGPRAPSMAVENVENGFLTTDKSYDDPNPSTG